jgi:hypothetical protein
VLRAIIGQLAANLSAMMGPALVQCTALGSFGRFGNQLFQYAFARAYAERYGALLEVPEWIGRRVFGLDDPYPSRVLPRSMQDCVPWGQVDIDLFGYFQKTECLSILSRDRLRQWFRIRPQWEAKAQLPGKPYIAAHLRRGDYVSRYSSLYCTVSRNSYIRACEQFELDASQLVWVSDEWPRPFCDPELDFMSDFLILKHADVLLRGNSTFSFWAGVLSDGRVFSPLVSGLRGEHDVPFVPGNWPRCADFCDDLTIPD